MNNQSEKHKIGVMGGTFNPIHYGHLVTAQEALSKYKLDKVIFMPSGLSVHKDNLNIIAAKQRFRMTVMATSDNDNFEVSDLEVNKKSPSYTIETIENLKEIYPNSEIYFITGADALLDILTWKEPEKVLGMATFIAAKRPGYFLQDLIKVINKINSKTNIIELEVPSLAISSTDIRNRVRENKPIRYLLPDKVWRYIYSKGFYI